MFLCSRDVNDGDIVRIENIVDIMPELKMTYYKWTDAIFEFESLSYSRLNYFKVIAEVSPEALAFIKGGDEFEDYELWWFNTEEDKPISKVLNLDVEKNNTNVYLACRVKGPCGHFH